MNHNLSVELKNLEDEIYNKYINNFNVFTGIIKTTITKKPNACDFLRIKINLTNRITNEMPNYCVGSISLSHKYFSRNNNFFTKHKWDCVGIICTFGLIIPFLIPLLLYDIYSWYNSTNYYYIKYTILAKNNIGSRI